MRLTDEQIQELQALEQDGRLTAERVLKRAARATSALHPLFEWNDAAAAYHHRLEQARSVIRQVITTVTTTHEEIRVHRYVPDPDAAGGPGYVTIDPLPDRWTQQRLVAAEIRRTLGLMRRCWALAEVFGLAEDMATSITQWEAWEAALGDDDDLTSAAAD